MNEPKNKPAAQGEPSMEEILASIRRIISEDGEPPKPGAATAPAAAAPATPIPPPVIVSPAQAPATDILELTEVVEDNPAATPASAPLPTPAPTAPGTADVESLVSTNVAAAATGSLASLMSAKRHTERSMSDNPMPLGNAGATIESIVREEVRSLLRTWLDQNLPPMVERLVQREIQRIGRGID